MNEIEALKNIAVNIDSETAKQIAEQYIRYKYFDTLTGIIAFIVFLVVVGFFLKKMTEDR